MTTGYPLYKGQKKEHKNQHFCGIRNKKWKGTTKVTNKTAVCRNGKNRNLLRTQSIEYFAEEKPWLQDLKLVSKSEKLSPIFQVYVSANVHAHRKKNQWSTKLTSQTIEKYLSVFLHLVEWTLNPSPQETEATGSLWVWSQADLCSKSLSQIYIYIHKCMYLYINICVYVYTYLLYMYVM